MPNTPETLSAILAEMRSYADRLDDAGGAPSPTDLRKFAGRIECAAKNTENAFGMALAIEDGLHKRDKQSTPGNAAALREALQKISHSIWSSIDPTCNDDCCKPKRELAKIADAAIAAPARNCDVGTAQEQIDRFHEFCHSNRVYIDEFHGYDCRPDCPIGKIVDRDNKFCDNCWAAWAQMPYAPAQEGGAE